MTHFGLQARWTQSTTRQTLRAVGFVVYTYICIHLVLVFHSAWFYERRPDPEVAAAERSRRRRELSKDGPRTNKNELRRSLSFTKDQSPQPESFFLSKLPLEVRREIYKLVLAGRSKHFIRLGLNDDEQASDFVLNCADYRTHDTSTWPPSYRQTQVWKARSNTLALPLTCRQVYLESIDLVYSLAAFKVSRLFTLQDLYVTLLPQRFNNIRSLSLAYEFRCGLPMVRDPAIREDADWEAFWEIMAKQMKGLQDLRIDLFSFDIRSLVGEDDTLVDTDDEKWTWLRHMLQVNGLRTCTARLHSAARVNVVHTLSPPISVFMMMVIDSLEKLISTSMQGKKLDSKTPLNLPNNSQVESIWKACRQLGG